MRLFEVGDQFVEVDLSLHLLFGKNQHDFF
jgi:hypothetical protein